jgi:hypothetical protein
MNIRGNNKSKSGFSLVETLVAISLSLLAVMMIVAIVAPGLKYVRTIKNNRILHSTTAFLMNQFDYWIKQGAEINVLTPSTLEIKIRLPDSSIMTKTIIKSGDNITLDGVPLTSDNVKVTNLVFTKMAHSVRISLELAKGDQTFEAETTVAQRNGF